MKNLLLDWVSDKHQRQNSIVWAGPKLADGGYAKNARKLTTVPLLPQHLPITGKERTMKDEIERPNLRLMRAQEFAAALMMEIGDILERKFDRNVRRAVHDRLIDVLYHNGACFTTDEERQKLGLEPRDGTGWTPSERVAYEKKRIEALQLMAASPFVDLT